MYSRRLRLKGMSTRNDADFVAGLHPGPISLVRCLASGKLATFPLYFRSVAFFFNFKPFGIRDVDHPWLWFQSNCYKRGDSDQRIEVSREVNWNRSFPWKIRSLAGKKGKIEWKNIIALNDNAFIRGPISPCSFYFSMYRTFYCTHLTQGRSTMTCLFQLLLRLT